MYATTVDYNLILILAFWRVLFFIMKKVAGTSKEAYEAWQAARFRHSMNSNS